jgi:hypothetical protein
MSNDRPFDLRVAQDVEPGWDSVAKFGENPDIDPGSFEDVWELGGKYVTPTEPRIHDISSTLAADAGTVVSFGTATGSSNQYCLIDDSATFITDGVAVGDTILNDTRMLIGQVEAVTSETEISCGLFGMRYPSTGFPNGGFSPGESYRVVTNGSTGASILYLQGLNANFLMETEFLVLNGTTAVSTAKAYVRQFRARVFGPNTSGAVGTISSVAQTDLTTSLQVVNGNNQTLMAIYTIPVNFHGYLTSFWGTLSKKQAGYSTVRLRVGRLSNISYIQHSRALGTSGSSGFKFIFDVPLAITGGADVFVEADSSANDMGVSAGFDIKLARI